ncbi:hypothetical protein HNR60_000208 [Rhodopseudomonas rhenobacensis]|uniref:Uncharacterized protein n=1 Tax=Rhodopseudomonas rhenobacensis TaxID=87461 RepID=A0A7W7Z069_9BRAD|nr:hypothetical protein [Rhodopseudomonas rhenobacensis]MBB5045479.1 hypothetical protein [Rhodopseudomonas rhenobacensis]
MDQQETVLLAIWWAVLTAASAYGSAYFTRLDPPSITWAKITFAGVLLLAYAATWATAPLVASVMTISQFYTMLCVFMWPMTFLGAPLCVGTIVGVLISKTRIV